MTIKRTPSELTVEQFKMILTDPEITYPNDLLVLQTLYSFKDHRGSLQDIVDFHNNPSLKSYNRMRFVERIATKYEIHYEERKDRSYKFWSVLFDGENVKRKVDGRTREFYEWILKPELITAMEELGLTGEQCREQSLLSPDELSEEEIRSYLEGMKNMSEHIVYQRSSEARHECIEYWMCQCVVCGFDFEKIYGDLGKDFIHVHHLKPLSEIGESYNVDPINDLRPVCPNCHAMLHRREPVLSIEELKKIIDDNRS